MNYISQLRYELQKQPMLTWTSILGTALAIFMIMTLYISNSVATVPLSPESNRDRMMYGKFMHLMGEESESSSSFNYEMGKRLYENLDGVERISYVGSDSYSFFVSNPGRPGINLTAKKVDPEFWKIMDFEFIYGSPLAKGDESEAVRPVVITESVAKHFFGAENSVGKEISIQYVPFKVKGVVKGASPIMPNSYAELYLPYRPEVVADADGPFGNTHVILLLKPGVSHDYLREQVKSRYSAFSNTIKATGEEAVYHQQPFDVDNVPDGSNNSPDSKISKILQIFIYLILLVLPAINLNAMTRSRLRSRVAEIGLHRAFGATRFHVLGRLLVENLLLTLIGGIIGLLFCSIFMATISGAFFSWSEDFTVRMDSSTVPEFGMIFNWSVFAIALLGCMILNLLSCGIPAYKASKMNPAEAIHGTN